MLYQGTNENGKPSYKYTGIQGEHLEKIERRHPKDILVPCKKCIGCRLDFSRKWADRLMLELDHSKTAIFLTLTYDDEHITPAMIDEENGLTFYTLVKKDLQDFNKRLRYYFPDKKIRFYACGEYGEQTLRPHFHGIYYGLDLSDFPDRVLKFLNKHQQPIYVSRKLESIWKNGLVSLANVSWQSCAYVARYNLKKLVHGQEHLAYSRNCIPEFSVMSRNPGIGGYFFEDHPEMINHLSDKIFLTDIYGVKSVDSIYLPSYNLDKLFKDNLVNSEIYDNIKAQRQEAALYSMLDELSFTDLDEFDYLSVKEKQHAKSSKCLSRSL